MLGLGESSQAKKRQRILSRDLGGIPKSIIQSTSMERSKRKFMTTIKNSDSHSGPKPQRGWVPTCYQQKVVFNIQKKFRNRKASPLACVIPRKEMKDSIVFSSQSRSNSERITHNPHISQWPLCLLGQDLNSIKCL